MLKARFVWRLFGAGVLMCAVGVAYAQDYPTKPVRIITTTAGGGSDAMSRMVAQGLSISLGHQFIVDNRGRGTIPSTTVARAAPDGYSLLTHNSAVWIAPMFLKAPPYDAARDLAPITSLARAPSLLVVHPSLPVKTVKELIALAKAKPGQLNFSSGANGDLSHVSGEIFRTMANINIVRVPYAGNANEAADLVSGQCQLTFSSPGSVAAMVKAGKLRAIAVGTTTPSILFPKLPTVSSTLPGFQSASIYGTWAPAKTPESVIRRLNQEIVRFINSNEIKEKLLTMQLEASTSSPEEFAGMVKTEIGRIGKMIKDTGVTAE